jgi:diguanylate cyclase (GGDEF)-like protein
VSNGYRINVMMDTNSYPELDETEITRQAELERFKVFNERATTGAYGSLLGIGLLGWVLVQAAGWQRALVWCCFVGTVELGISLNGWRGRRSLASGNANAQILYTHHLLAGFAGVAWGSVVYFIWTGEDLMAYLATIAILVGVSGVTMVTLSSYAVPATLFFASIYLLPLLHELLYPKPISLQVGVTHDQLTGAFSRRYILDQLERQLAFRQRHSTAASLVMFDLDHFKRVNDNFGHPVGDKVLKEAVAAVAAQLRDGDVLARIGGEEFLVLLPMTDIHAALQLAERLRHTLANTCVIEGSDVIHMPASFGVAELREAEAASHWFKRVDDALYQAKAAGRNTVSAAT